MAGRRQLEFSCFALVTICCMLVKGQLQQNQQAGGEQLPGQQGRRQQIFKQQAGGQQLEAKKADVQQSVGQQGGGQSWRRAKGAGQPQGGQQVGGQQLLGQQAENQQLPAQQKVGQVLQKQDGSHQGQNLEVPVQKQKLAQNLDTVQSNSVKEAPRNINVQVNSVDLNNNKRNAAPIVQDNSGKLVKNMQQLDSQKNKIDIKQSDNQQRGLAGVPVDSVGAKLETKKTNKIKAEDTGDKKVDSINDAGANSFAKIPDLHGNVNDQNVNRPKDSAQNQDFQAVKTGNINDVDVAKVVNKNDGGALDLAHPLEKQGIDNQVGNKDPKVEAHDINRDGNKAAGDRPSDTGGLPDHIKIVDGEVEKNKGNTADADIKDDGDDDVDEDKDDDDEDDEYYDNSPQRADTKIDSGVINAPAAPAENDLPKFVAVQVDKDKTIDIPNAVGNANMDNNVVRNDAKVGNVEPEKDKEGSLKVVWDWSDFAVNFEQYVMPEQKIRRAPHATTGEPWPMPQYYVTKKDKVYTIHKSNFRIKLSKVRCDIIEKAIERYRLYIFEDAVEDMYDNFQHAQSTMFEDPSTKYEQPLYLEAPYLTKLDIKIRKPCGKYPQPKSDESYDLFVKRTGVHLWANEVWGALRGLETFSQLVFKGTNQQLYVRDTVINDYPRFSHRGVMIDSSRHFIFKETIYDALEGMAQNKMNVMHWHLVDDQSFPFYSQVYPDLSAKGAFHPTFVYMPEDIADIIEFARMRGIRVEPEFDTPGHTYSWGLSRPDLLTQCYQGDRPVDGYLGPMDPSKNETFRFLSTFFKDVLHSFKDQYIHLGGDEVPMTCWQSNPEVVKFLGKLEGRTDLHQQTNDPYYYSYDVRKVLEYYVTRLIKDLKNIGSKRTNGVRFVFWQEIMNNDVQLPNDTIIHVWSGGMEDVQRATSLNLNVIYSTCWYLDLIEYGTKWSKYYQCDPADTSYGYSLDESKILGGEACLWAEYIDNENLMTTLWPRASAAAERLWSSKDVRDLDAAATRLQEHRCRMLSRGLGVGQISGPDYCLRRGKRRHLVNETSTNCTQSQCAVYNEKGRVEVEKIKVEFEQKGGRMSDCSQAVIQAGSQLTLILLMLISIAVVITLKFSKQKIIQVRMCRNKSIMFVFITLILIYFMCYTSVWMQAMQFKGSFEKRVSSNVS